MTQEALESSVAADDGVPAEPPPRRIVLDVPSWVPTEKIPRWLLIGVLLVVVVVAFAGSAVPFALGWVSQDDLETLGYPGIFLAESTAYLMGVIGRGLAEERQAPLKGRLGRWMHRSARRIDWLMARYGFATLLLLSAIPNPFFEFAGITAGAVRMNFWRFLLAVGVGKTARGG